MRGLTDVTKPFIQKKKVKTQQKKSQNCVEITDKKILSIKN
jgi:hypothetical protein